MKNVSLYYTPSIYQLESYLDKKVQNKLQYRLPRNRQDVGKAKDKRKALFFMLTKNTQNKEEKIDQLKDQKNKLIRKRRGAENGNMKY